MEVASDGAAIDQDALRAALSKELGVPAIAPWDARADARRATIRIRVEPAHGALWVEYEEGSRLATRRVPLPFDDADVVKTAVFVAGNLARNEADEIAELLDKSRATRSRSIEDGAPQLSEPDEGQHRIPPRRYWVGASVEFDGMLVPEERNANVCLAAEGYFCTNWAGRDVSPNTGAGYQPGVGLNGTLLLSFDYAANERVLIGGRLGLTWFHYAGARAPNRWTPGALHLEARSTYLFGDAPLTSARTSFFVLGGLGVSQYDAILPQNHPESGSILVWRQQGPAFITMGAGFRIPLSPRTVMMAAPAKATIVGPFSFNAFWSPEFSLSYGF